MDALTILYYGHETLKKAIARVHDDEWEIGGVCGVWTAKDVVGHLSMYELRLAEVLSMQLDENAETPLMQQSKEHGSTVNDIQAALRKDWPVEQVLQEYHDAHERVMELAKQIPEDLWPKKGAIPWYGDDYSLDDFIVYTNYAHKREHAAQLDVLSDHQGH